MATFYGIGVGPGDSDLLTLKAVNTLQALDILYVPQAHKGQASVAERIAMPHLPATLVVKRRHFPMVKDLTEKQQSWREIATEIVADVQDGKNVGFVTLGDPSVYSTYSYLVELIDHQIDVQTIAGISAFSQIAASISVPLTLDDELLEVLPATADLTTIEKAIDVKDNVVIMKISANFPAIYDLLAQRDLLQHAILISNASMDQQTKRTLADIAPTEKLPYFSTLLLKKRVQFAAE